MTADARIIETSSKKLGQVHADLDKLGRRELAKELRSELGKASKPARMKVRDLERNALPSGMDKSYSKVPTQLVSVNKQGVKVRWKHARKNSDMQALNKGRLRHPLFGNRKFWYEQQIPVGMWDKAIDKVAPEVIGQTAEKLLDFVERKVDG